jgi:transcription antitermination factor NusG
LVKLSTADRKKWIAVYTRPRHEKTVEQELIDKRFETYLPILRERRKWSDRKKWIEFPMFRSYVFTRITFNQVLPVLETIGVVKIIKFGNKPAVVQDEHIEGIKLMIEGGFVAKFDNFYHSNCFQDRKYLVESDTGKNVGSEHGKLDPFLAVTPFTPLPQYGQISFEPFIY